MTRIEEIEARAKAAIHRDTCAFWISPWNLTPSGNPCDSSCEPEGGWVLYAEGLEQELVDLLTELREAQGKLEAVRELVVGKLGPPSSMELLRILKGGE